MSSTATKLPNMSGVAQIAALEHELRLIARRGIYRFGLDDVPTFHAILNRASTERRRCTVADMRQAIQDGLSIITERDAHRHMLGRWLFTLDNESRKYDLTERRRIVGRSISRSSSAIRQIDEPRLISELAEFFVKLPHRGFPLRPLYPQILTARDTAKVMYIVLRSHMSVALNPYDFRKSRTTIIDECQAMKTTDLLITVARLPHPNWHHGVTHKSQDGRMMLLPVGHPYRQFEEDLTYRIDPPYAPGECFHHCMRHRYLFDEHEPTGNCEYDDPSVLRRSTGCAFESVEEITLSITLPTRWHCSLPTWFEYDLARQRELRSGPMPCAFQGKRCQRFATAFPNPSPTSSFGILLDARYEWPFAE